MEQVIGIAQEAKVDIKKDFKCGCVVQTKLHQYSEIIKSPDGQDIAVRDDQTHKLKMSSF